MTNEGTGPGRRRRGPKEPRTPETDSGGTGPPDRRPESTGAPGSGDANSGSGAGRPDDKADKPNDKTDGRAEKTGRAAAPGGDPGSGPPEGDAAGGDRDTRLDTGDPDTVFIVPSARGPNADDTDEDGTGSADADTGAGTDAAVGPSAETDTGGTATAGETGSSEAAGGTGPGGDADDSTFGGDTGTERTDTAADDGTDPRHTGADAGAGSDTDASGDADASADAGVGPSADTGASTGAGTDKSTSTGASVGTGSDTEPGTEPDPGTGTDTDENADTDADAAVGPSAETDPGAHTDTGTHGTRQRHGIRWRRVLLWTAASLVLLMAATVGGAYVQYQSLRSDMSQHDIESALVEEDRPDSLDDAVNVLFIGSDGYEEDSPAYTQEFEGERSDSLMLANISPDGRASVVSFPRDSLVQLPECDPYGEAEGTQPYRGMLNAAMYHGGPPCVVHTVETLTDIRIDHFVHLSFASFRDVVDAIGGVEICIPEPMEDERAKLELEAGDQVLDGETALSFVRARYEIGDGGDIGRIDRQQMFMAALADQVTSSDVLTSPRKMNAIAETVAEHSATDGELTLDRMVSIAFTLADVDLSDIAFHTVPWYQDPYDPNRIVWNAEEAEKLFAAVREGKPLPELMAADEARAPQEPPGSEPEEVVSPEEGSEAGDSEGPEEASETPEPSEGPSARPGEGRDATSDPCEDGLGFGTEVEE